MKKMLNILILVCIALLYSCNNNGKTYTLVYEIYWSPSNIERKTITSHEPIIWDSFHGTNIIKANIDGNWWVLEETSAPIRKVSYTCKDESKR